jgi:hypothetical protein
VRPLNLSASPAVPCLALLGQVVSEAAALAWWLAEASRRQPAAPAAGPAGDRQAQVLSELERGYQAGLRRQLASTRTAGLGL